MVFQRLISMGARSSCRLHGKNNWVRRPWPSLLSLYRVWDTQILWTIIGENHTLQPWIFYPNLLYTLHFELRKFIPNTLGWVSLLTFQSFHGKKSDRNRSCGSMERCQEALNLLATKQNVHKESNFFLLLRIWILFG